MISRSTTKTVKNSRAWVLAAMFLLMGVSRGFCQPSGATVTFANNASCRIINGVTGHAVTTNEDFQVALFCAPTNSTAFTQVGAAVSAGWPVAGVFAGSARDCAGVVQPGAPAQLQVRVWPKSFSNFDDALSSGAPTAQSAVLQIQTGNANAIPAVPPPSLAANGLQALTISSSSHPNQLWIDCVNGNTVISLPVAAGVTYSVQYAPTIYGPWTDLPGSIAVGVNAKLSCKDDQPTTGMRFYRALAQP